MKTLAIETSCDDTSLALVIEENGFFKSQKMLTDTQKFHDDYGGVVPEMASRAHANRILPVFERFLSELGWDEKNFSDQIDCISVTVTPGLPGSLMIGKTFAHLLGERYDKPVIEVNHLYGHVLSMLLDRSRQDIVLPMIVLSASGGHSDLYLVSNNEDKRYTSEKVGLYDIAKLGGSLDDAAGEAFDKVARMLGGPYPGGKWIGERATLYELKVKSEKLKVEDDFLSDKKQRSPYYFKRTMLEEGSWDFSFSGMKSQAYNFIQKIKNNDESVLLYDEQINEIAYEFQEAMTDVLSKKLLLAGEKFKTKTIGLVGGVSANNRLREKLTNNLTTSGISDIDILMPIQFEYCTDNAAMIGVIGLLMS